MKLKFWTNFPTWLKGGIIGVIIALIGIVGPPLIEALNIINRDLSPNVNPNMSALIMMIFIPFHSISLILTLSGTFGCQFKSDPCTTESVVGYIITVFLFFGIWSWLGWMKSKKKLKLAILILLIATIVIMTTIIMLLFL
jgi:hypothetical protein